LETGSLGAVRLLALFSGPFLCSRLSVFALTSPLIAGGQSVVPSEDYSHAPPCYAVFFREGRKTETEPQSTKKKTMKTITEKNSESGLTSRPEPLSTEMQMQFDFSVPAPSCKRKSGHLLTLLQAKAATILIWAAQGGHPSFIVSGFANHIAHSGCEMLSKLRQKFLHFQR
jgi:hypothetical protein